MPAVLLLLTVCAACGKVSATTISLRKIQGIVGILDEKGRNLKPNENLMLYHGYDIETDQDSYAWIDLDDVKLAKMDENSEIVIEKKGKKLEVIVGSGSLFFRVTQPLAEDETMTIRTSSMTVGIRGTCGWVETDEAYILEGTVEVKAGDSTAPVSVPAGQMAHLSVSEEGEHEIVVKPFSKEDIASFVLPEIEGDETLYAAISEAPEPPAPEPPEAPETPEVPAAEPAQPVVLDSGTYGENLTWSLTDDSVLTISGEGEMRDRGTYGHVPWEDLEFTSAVIEPGVASIGEWAFWNCRELTDVSIPDSVTDIGPHAFSQCKSLARIDIPDQVVHIGGYAFSGCDNLTEAAIGDGLLRIGSFAFEHCRSLYSINLPDGVTSIGNAAFLYCTALTDINIPSGVSVLQSGVFERCTSLSTVSLPDGLTDIERHAFYYCSSLTGIVLPESLSSIGMAAFRGCTSLERVVIPDGVSKLYTDTFAGCSSLTSVILPSGTNSIGSSMFAGCSSLTDVTLPSSVTRIGTDAFRNCAVLSDVYYGGSEEEWSSIRISGNNAPLRNANIHFSSIE